jgi:hypothetical protein
MSKVKFTQHDVDIISSQLTDIEIEFSIHTEYSGREMYNAKCFGIITDESAFNLGFGINQVMTNIKELHPDLYDKMEYIFCNNFSPKVDSMGKSMIYYWPQIEVED